MLELGVSFPSEFKLRGFQGKRVLRALVQRSNPRSLLPRRKKGFAAPVDETHARPDDGSGTAPGRG